MARKINSFMSKIAQILPKTGRLIFEYGKIYIYLENTDVDIEIRYDNGMYRIVTENEFNVKHYTNTEKFSHAVNDLTGYFEKENKVKLNLTDVKNYFLDSKYHDFIGEGTFVNGIRSLFICDPERVCNHRFNHTATIMEGKKGTFDVYADSSTKISTVFGLDNCQDIYDAVEKAIRG